MRDQNERRLTANEHMSVKSILFKNFLGGVAWGVGSIIGATVVISLLVWILRSIDFVPVVRTIVSEISRDTIENP